MFPYIVTIDTDDSRKSEYWVLSTDYETYALVYSCRLVDETKNDKSEINIWKLGKKPGKLPEEAQKNIDTIINNLLEADEDIESLTFYYRSHSEKDCNTYVKLPGTCPLVTGVSNFNVNRFIGRWIEVSRYPNKEQIGECNRVEYTFGATTDIVGITTSEVYGEVMRTITGDARIGSTGLLQVTLRINGVNRNVHIYVLATDYENYALLYGCVDLPDNRRQIYSWLLRRTEILTPEIIHEIYNDIDDIDGVDQVYFQKTSQDDSDCFYYPKFDTLPETIEFLGSCPSIGTTTVFEEFDFDKYLGTWYEVARYPQPTQTGQCSRAVYAATDTTGIVSVVNTEVDNEALTTISGQATAIGTSGEFEVTLDGSIKTRKLHVLAIDYNSYALVYSCNNIGVPGENRRRVSSWILSRQPLSGVDNDAIDEVIESTEGLHKDYYQDTYQTDAACFHYPVFEKLPDTIELIGSCPTVTGVEDFDWKNYFGTWYEVARYPQPKQTGQCSNTVYTAGDTPGLFTVVNTEVDNEKLTTISGHARAISTSGEFEVTLDGSTETRKLHVLATDYNSYALVYSCVDIVKDGENRRQVSSWKLSRRPQSLSDVDNDAIDDVITSTEGLHKDYYLDTYQTDAACFHYPEVDELPGTVELRGSCPAIAGIKNFNLENYLGTWYEVARYPQPTQTGQCSRAVYAATDTTGIVSVVNTEVNNEELTTISGHARATAQFGVLEVIFNVEGLRTTNLHVLATDYSSYALVYSCVDIQAHGENRRRVSSWKLSRHPLSNPDNADIDDAISSTEGLHKDYYQNTYQTDAACFHYPKFEELPETIELRGPCPTVTGLAHFELNNYLGTWYEVARYPQPSQTGQCSRAVYAATDTTGIVSVVNTEVNNEELTTISGHARATDQSGVLEVTINDMTTTTLYVLATDYKNFALVYSCVDRNENGEIWRRVSSWILSGQPQPLSGMDNDAIDEVIESTEGLHKNYYQVTYHSDAACFHYPVYEELPDTIELIGSCPTITGVEGFNLINYLGTWYEIARYPQKTQTGQCSRAVYAATDTTGIVSVVNTEVNNEELTTISGHARATAQSGVLEVIFNIDDMIETTNLYVLATDYNSYALVYSCDNIEGLGENRRRVSSWILSRRPQSLSEADNAAINDVITSTEGLHKDYYQDTYQTEAACFHYPEFQELPDTIELLGSCPTVTGAENFDLNGYLGTWYEVARYPQPSQTGQCSRAVYAATDTTGIVSVVNTEVDNEALTTISGQATAIGTSGEFEVTLDGSIKTRKLHVLAIDYNSYALVYSCNNIGVPGENRRRVSSWILSRHPQPLSGVDNDAIDEVIESTEGLHKDYYQDTYQTDAACFHYPVFEKLPDTIELIGSCPTVTGVEDFDWNNYFGTWYEVARYPQPKQTGQCSNTVYTAGDIPGLFTVVNTEVDNEALTTISGQATAIGTSGEFEVTLDGSTETRKLHVLATDYNNYALVYSCNNIVKDGGNRRQVSSWKLSRHPQPLSDVDNDAIDDVITSTEGLHKNYYLDTYQTDAACFHYPEVDELPGTVELRGSCPAIASIKNFNLENYLGTWYEVARYPQPTQTGQCSRAVYAATDTTGIVSVVNTEVNNEELTTISGHARATAQSGVLEVIFNVEGLRTTNLHVLATDYSSYALVYSCVDIQAHGENRRRVSSWKLSRHPLSNPDNADIDDAIASTEGLHKDYYQNTYQTDAACFHYPKFEELPETIELRGPCPTVTGLAHFELNNYLGTWYEVARYPQPSQTGQCSRAVYAATDTTGIVSVVNTEVNNEELTTISGHARATDQSGVLEVTINDMTTTTLYVLATDYKNFALVYSCVDRNENGEIWRRVSSWILSGQPQPLSGMDNDAIDEVIESTEGLHKNYYQVTYHNDAACFHYPVYEELPDTIELIGSCPTITGVEGFNLINYLGTWYEIARYPQKTQTGQCSRAVYAATDTTGIVSVVNTEVDNEALTTISGHARATAQSGVLEVIFNIDDMIETTNLYVLATDYNSYALVYSCDNIEGLGENRRRVSSWILSRRPQSLSEADNAAINDVITSTEGLHKDYYQDTYQTEAACFHYPEFQELPDTIELLGSCPTVTGAENFDLNGYLGTWYEVARYPQPSQTGQCSRAVYAATDTTGIVSVVNTEVDNEELTTISGHARATAQSGVLEVIFNVDDMIRTTNLYVLATNYRSFALVYSCDNVQVDGENRRRVSSWKLSRRPQSLYDVDNDAIDKVIASTEGLHKDYYQDTYQTDAACFHYPVFEELPETIELIGSCSTVIGVKNFDLTAFLGTWYEVARFPQPTQTGQCSRAVYADGDIPGAVSVVNTEVNNEELTTIYGDVEAIGTSGELKVNLYVDGVIKTTNLQILATNYNSFALVYSCDNIDNQEGQYRRRVNSWKLSRRPQPLSDADNAAIDDIITSTEGLHKDYYQDTDHTDAACFHYPEFKELPNTIELRGSCPTLAGVNDFNLNSFLGTWYEVARYPQPTQTGQCSRAVYAATDTTGIVSVVNTEVNNEELTTISGHARATAQSGVLEVTINDDGVIRTTNLHVLATDYNSYALLYSCDNIQVQGENRRRVSSWKLSRRPHPLSDANNAAIDDVITSTEGLHKNYYLDTYQTDAACFYYPEVDELPDTVELRGPCPAIAGVENFNLNAYLGTWYEVARYPQPAQLGQCSRAVYAPGASPGVVTVVNTEVKNETLTTILGEVRAVGQSATLAVNLNVGGENKMSYVTILATDYANYALVYSCIDILAGYESRRRVSSWKLSRTPELSDGDNATINAVISTTEGLNNNYYQDTFQTDASCFYYPVFEQLPSIIELPGPCPIIFPVNNFDIERYLGTWYEFARYPQPGQIGQCSRDEYASVEGGISVVNYRVIDEVLFTTTREVRTTDQPGVFELDFDVDGDNRTTNFYVLATDYDNYALLYSCVNIEGNRRRVGSWKLSRNTNLLVEEAKVAMDKVISDTQGLNEDYYLTTKQDDGACFHYPAQNGDNVIIPGRCNTTISGVANLNLTRFTNGSVWYHIQSYDAVVGTCVATRLTLNGNYINLINIERIGNQVKVLRGLGWLSSASDGKLTFNMDDSDEQVDIYILATDYDGFAIAYNCKNIGTNERQIGAWQLSRTRTMPDAGQEVLNELIETTQEFTDFHNYFKIILHPNSAGDQCPEPSSAFLIKSRIIVILVCAVLQLL